MGCIIAKDILPVGCCMGVRTAKGDISTPVSEDTVVIIGEDGSVRISNLDRLNKSFRIYKDWRFTVKQTDYVPKFKNKDTETIVDGMAHARVCIPVEEDFSRAFGMPSGVNITAVSSGSPAEKCGLQTGDIICEFNGKTVTDITELQKMIAKLQPGDTVKIGYYRYNSGNYEQMSVDAVLEAKN